MSGEWSHHHGYLRHEDLFCTVLLYSCHFFLIASTSFRSIQFLSFIAPIFAWKVPLVSLIFLKRSLVFPILLFSSISLHWLLRKAFLFLLAILSVQFNSFAQSCPTLCDPMDCSMPGLLSITNSRSLLKLISTESVMPSNYLILCHPLLLPSIFPSIRVFSSESDLCIRWPKYQSFSFSISPSN